MITDRQRVERVLIPMMLKDVVINGARELSAPDVQKSTMLLQVAAMQQIDDLVPKEQRKIMRRVKRTHDALLAAYKEGEAHAGKVGLLIFYMLQELLESDYLILHAGSALQQALALILPELERLAGIGPLNASAKKAARAALQKLQKMGYYS
jgi:hypothetical protein